MGGKIKKSSDMNGFKLTIVVACLVIIGLVYLLWSLISAPELGPNRPLLSAALIVFGVCSLTHFIYVSLKTNGDYRQFCIVVCIFCLIILSITLFISANFR